MNYEIKNKEYIIQHTGRGWRCISHHPHYIMTQFVKSKEQGILDGDKAIEKYYEKLSVWGDNQNFDIKPRKMFKL
jgi:hypothetical protein